MFTCHIFRSKFFLISAGNSILFSRKIIFNYHNLIKCWTAPQEEKISFSEHHGPAEKWAGCYLNCEAMCPSITQMFFIKYHVITRLMADKLCCTTSCKAVRPKFQHKESKGWEFCFPLKLIFYISQEEEMKRRKVHSKNKENVWKLRINTIILKKQCDFVL